jgi:type IV pilus assembly protein PilA
MTNQKGFTLIELMIVVAIIAILAAIAISQYQDYVIRSQVSEGSALADGVKTAVAEFNNNYGRFSTTGTNASYGLSAADSISGSYVVSVGVHTGRILAHFSSASPRKANTQINGQTLGFSPITHAGSIEWNCASVGAGTSTLLKNKWRPVICRT